MPISVFALDTRSTAAKVGYVRKSGPSAKAGIKVGDVLVAIDGAFVANTNDLAEAIGNRKVEEKVTVVVSRDGEYVQIPVILGSRANPNGE